MNNRVQYFRPGGSYRGKFGSAGSGPAQLSGSASGLTVGPDGRILIADTGNHRISAFSAAGLPLQQIGSQGSGLSQFDSPADFSVGTDGYAIAADTQNNRLVAYELAGSSSRAIAPIGVLGSSVGMFDSPTGVLCLDDDVVAVADTGNNRIQILQLEYGTDGQEPYVPEPISCDGLSCTDCHLADARLEHDLKTSKGRQSCHTPRAAAAGGYGSYSSNPTCYRTEHWDSLEEFTESDGYSSTETAGPIEGDEAGVLVQVSTYIGNLIGSVTGAEDSSYTDAELDAVHSSFMGDEVEFSTDAAIDSLPPSAVPASKPASLGSILGTPQPILGMQ